MEQASSGIVIVNQHFGIGDIIWSQTLIRQLAAGRRIVWGVMPQYVDALNRAYPDICFMDYRLVGINPDRRDGYRMHGAEIIPIRFADAKLKAPYNQCMRAKYDYYSKDWRTWKEKAAWQRDVMRELQFFSRLGIEAGKYNLINNYAGTERQLVGKISVDNGLVNVDMRQIEQYSLFDWAYILENAAHIHTVSTSIIYVLEMLDLQAPEINYYLKPNEADFSSTKYICHESKHKYVYHE